MYSWEVSRGIRLVTLANEFVKFLATVLELQSNSHLSHLVIGLLNFIGIIEVDHRSDLPIEQLH